MVCARHPAASGAWTQSVPPEQAAFDAIAEAVRRQIDLPREPARARLVPGQMVIATSPVRIDLAGGWSDTPPICNELGGTVLNTAVTLSGRQPLQAVAQLSQEPVIRITSIDLGRSVELTHTKQLLRHDDPRDWSALPKAALVLAGLAPSDPDIDLRGWLEGVGGGIRLTVFAALPKGSGLGTSSILGATVLAALSRLTGEVAPREMLTTRTSMLEQLMRTGGGWQDQLGGIVPGFKLLRTAPGFDQSPAVEEIRVPAPHAAELSSRLILYYTGLQRLAADILQKVVGRYLAREPECLAIVRDLKAGAERMAAELGAGDIDAFASSLLDYWRLKQRFDPGSTTPAIEALFDTVRDRCAGYELPGAGGGGFLLLVARDTAAAAQIRECLGAHQPNPTARLYEASIDSQGLCVTVV
ncbi:MAG: hypothetical protein IPJ41_17675 [Phycisphaerales bacterium]|nr:hypothetical protein [Phycisphaerales bacterium]